MQASEEPVFEAPTSASAGAQPTKAARTQPEPVGDLEDELDPLDSPKPTLAQKITGIFRKPLVADDDDVPPDEPEGDLDDKPAKPSFREKLTKTFARPKLDDPDLDLDEPPVSKKQLMAEQQLETDDFDDVAPKQSFAQKIFGRKKLPDFDD